MSLAEDEPAPRDRPPRAARAPVQVRWWPLVGIAVVTAIILAVVRTRENLPFQSRNLFSLAILLGAFALVWLWWLLASRTPWRWRLVGCAGAILLVGLCALLFRIRGVSGDLLPILEFRWTQPTGSQAIAPNQPVVSVDQAPATDSSDRPDFPQFLGPDRNCVIRGPRLSREWDVDPPTLIWRQPLGAAWSGFAIVGNRAVTQEQRDDQELVTCYDLLTGRRLWEHGDQARYETTIAGIGPRCTPTVAGDRVLALGATGILNCLSLEDGAVRWSRRIDQDAKSSMPGWGFAGSPLVHEDRVVVSAGGADGRSLLAYALATGEIAWSEGSAPTGYSSPFLAALNGAPQILMFNADRLTAHAPSSGKVLWDYPWGKGQPHVAVPVVVASNRIVISSGYGVGAALLELRADTSSAAAPERIWKSGRLKAKFANFVERDGFLYGLDDGILTCVDIRDGDRVWKEGRYGHGQMLLIDDLLLVSAERGDLVLLSPTPEGANELHRFAVLEGKTWNPPALAGSFLLMRNDREAACLRLPINPSGNGARVSNPQPRAADRSPLLRLGRAAVRGW